MCFRIQAGNSQWAGILTMSLPSTSPKSAVATPAFSNPRLFCMYFEYEGCPESIQPFWISREPVAWPWCNLAASQRRPYCASVNSHSPVGLVNWQWEVVDWACVLSDRCIHNDRASRSASSWQSACPFYSSGADFFLGGGGQSITSPKSVSPPYSPDLAPCHLWLFSKLKSWLKGRRFVNATLTQYTNSVDDVSLPTD